MAFDHGITGGAGAQGRKRMIKDVLQWIVGGFLAPRTTVRRLIDGNHGYDVAAQLFLLGFLIEAMAFLALGLRGEISSVIGWYVGNLVELLLSLAVLALVAWQLGRLSGGTGTFVQMILGIAWYSMMIALLAPFVVPFLAEFEQFMLASREQESVAAVPEISQGMLLGASFAAVTSLWLMANAIAAVHGFQNVWGVIGVILGIPFALVMILTMISGGGA